MAKSTDMPREVYDSALRAALDAEIARRRPASNWTLEIDREIWRAAQEHRLGARAISTAMLPLYPWATRNAVEGRLAVLRKHGGPEGMAR